VVSAPEAVVVGAAIELVVVEPSGPTVVVVVLGLVVLVELVLLVDVVVVLVPDAT
jgi:hypothetical protein